MIKITTLNMNGIRAASAKGFWTWVEAELPDVLCLQEIRATKEQFPPAAISLHGFEKLIVAAKRPGYSGVAIYSRIAPLSCRTEIGDALMDEEGRFAEVELESAFIASVYFPSGSSGEHRQAIKYQFLDVFDGYLREVKQRTKPTIICGDWNIAHKEIDLKNWQANRKNSGFLPEERAWMDRVIDKQGFVDAFRTVNQERDQYTWWSSRGSARAKNVGWRIDYQIVSPALRDTVHSAAIHTETIFSDHAPLTMVYLLPNKVDDNSLFPVRTT